MGPSTYGTSSHLSDHKSMVHATCHTWDTHKYIHTYIYTQIETFRFSLIKVPTVLNILTFRQINKKQDIYLNLQHNIVLCDIDGIQKTFFRVSCSKSKMWNNSVSSLKKHLKNIFWTKDAEWLYPVVLQNWDFLVALRKAAVAVDSLSSGDGTKLARVFVF